MKINELKTSFLFRGIDEEIFNDLLSASPPTVKCFKRGECIYSSKTAERLCGFVLSGKCEVRIERNDGSHTLLNSIGEGGSFGILSIYSSEEFPTHIYAVKNSEICFFTADQIGYFVNNYSQITTNLLKFYAERISFLNKKLATFSGIRVEDRLSKYLSLEREKHKSDIFPFNCQKTSEEINAGRASVYRAICSLEELGLIKLHDKQIEIIDPSGLERK